LRDPAFSHFDAKSAGDEQIDGPMARALYCASVVLCGKMLWSSECNIKLCRKCIIGKESPENILSVEFDKYTLGNEELTTRTFKYRLNQLRIG